jgi:plasmid stabilization system protein ParE
LRLDWSDAALRQLEIIVIRAPVQAGQVLSEIERLVSLPFPSRYRRLHGGRENEHVLPVPPHVVIYTVDANRSVRVLAVVDGRRTLDAR